MATKQLFIIRAVKPKANDPFHFFPNNEFVYLYCSGLKDLRATMRHINPRGYRIKSAAWFSKYLKIHNNDLVLMGGFITAHEKFRIIKIDFVPDNIKTFDFENRENKTYPLKSFNNPEAITSIASLFNDK